MLIADEIVAPERWCLEKMRSKSLARSMRGLTRRVKLVLVSAALLSAATSAPIALALTTHHTGVNRQAERRAPTGVASRYPHRRANAHAPAFAHASIIGGAPAEDGSFPSLAYIVDVQGRFVYQCTGTVVAPNLILTAAHCAENMSTGVVSNASGFRVVTGTVDPMAPEPQTSAVVGVIVYPGLVRRVDNGDAALLVLATPTTAPPITLATSSGVASFQAGSPAVMVGWGITSYEQKLPTERLRSAATVVQGRRWCTGNAPPFYPRGEICTITPPSYATGACSGDSGGPLLVPAPANSPAGSEPVEIGVAVHVYGKCSTRRPSVYTSAASISSWVHTWIEAYKSSPSPTAPSPPPTVPAPSVPVPSAPVPSPPAS
jgi:trypsin